MDRTDVIATLKILKVAYPGFYSKMSKTDAEDTVSVWCDMFLEEDVNIVKIALYKVIEEHTGFPPTIADIKTQIREMRRAATGEKTDEELWSQLKAAVSNGYYGAKEEFAKLPPELQRYLGTPNTLRELSQVDTDTFNTVTHGQFLKQIGIIRDRVRFDNETTPEIKALLGTVTKQMPANNRLTENEFNESRNRLLDTLRNNP